MAKMKTHATTPENGLQLEPYQVILRPVVTEKSMQQSQDNDLNAYTFEFIRSNLQISF